MMAESKISPSPKTFFELMNSSIEAVLGFCMEKLTNRHSLVFLELLLRLKMFEIEDYPPGQWWGLVLCVHCSMDST